MEGGTQPPNTTTSRRLTPTTNPHLVYERRPYHELIILLGVLGTPLASFRGSSFTQNTLIRQECGCMKLSFLPQARELSRKNLNCVVATLSAYRLDNDCHPRPQHVEFLTQLHFTAPSHEDVNQLQMSESLSSALKEMFGMPSISTNTCINPPLHGHPDALMKIPDCFATRHKTVTEVFHIGGSFYFGDFHVYGRQAVVCGYLGMLPSPANRTSPQESLELVRCSRHPSGKETGSAKRQILSVFDTDLYVSNPSHLLRGKWEFSEGPFFANGKKGNFLGKRGTFLEKNGEKDDGQVTSQLGGHCSSAPIPDRIVGAPRSKQLFKVSHQITITDLGVTFHAIIDLKNSYKSLITIRPVFPGPPYFIIHEASELVGLLSLTRRLRRLPGFCATRSTSPERAGCKVNIFLDFDSIFPISTYHHNSVRRVKFLCFQALSIPILMLVWEEEKKLPLPEQIEDKNGQIQSSKEGGELFCPDRDSSPKGILSGAPRSTAPAQSFRCCSILTSITLIGSEDHDVKSSPNLSPPTAQPYLPSCTSNHDLRKFTCHCGDDCMWNSGNPSDRQAALSAACNTARGSVCLRVMQLVTHAENNVECHGQAMRVITLDFGNGVQHARVKYGRRRCHWSADFLGDLPFPPPPHSGVDPYSPPFTLIGSQDLDVKNQTNLFAHSRTAIRELLNVHLYIEEVILSCVLRLFPDILSGSQFPTTTTTTIARTQLWYPRSEITTRHEFTNVDQLFGEMIIGYWGDGKRLVFVNVTPLRAFSPPACPAVLHGHCETASGTKPMRVIEVSMERHRNGRAGEAGDPQENLPTNGIVRHDSHMRKSGESAGGERRGVHSAQPVASTLLSRVPVPSVNNPPYSKLCNGLSRKQLIIKCDRKHYFMYAGVLSSKLRTQERWIPDETRHGSLWLVGLVGGLVDFDIGSSGRTPMMFQGPDRKGIRMASLGMQAIQFESVTVSPKGCWSHGHRLLLSTLQQLAGPNRLNALKTYERESNISRLASDEGCDVARLRKQYLQRSVHRAIYSQSQTMTMIEMSMEQKRNEREGETGDPRENPPTKDTIRHDSHMRK
ncbi:hypothetical protein PR048_001211 [Dryococelus australis]|uniref:Uncharacterized protein n=1 Tax=Dryococelus australis TaxID=614101 RepID=A0ABQ9IGT4_9NEOP|nr:hypothetical protein PR048_001211 [Dryococelus australis]